MNNSRPKTLREAYGLFESVGITENGERRARTERFLRLRWRGVPFGDSPIEFCNDDDTEINYSKEMAEAISFTHLAVAANIDDMIANIKNRTPPAPDLYAELIDGSHVYVEVGQIVASASARYFAKIEKINQYLMRRERDEPAYLDEFASVMFLFNFLWCRRRAKLVPRQTRLSLCSGRSISILSNGAR